MESQKIRRQRSTCRGRFLMKVELLQSQTLAHPRLLGKVKSNLYYGHRPAELLGNEMPSVFKVRLGIKA